MKQFDVLSFHPGKQHNLEQAAQLGASIKSFRHLTGLYFDKITIQRLQNIAPKIATRLKLRTGALHRSAIDTNAAGELKMLAKRKLGFTLGYDDYLSRNRFFQNWVVQKYKAPKICIGFDTSSWMVFEKWKNDAFLILDLTVAPPQYKLTLAHQYGLSADFVAKQTTDDRKLYGIYEKELELADLVLCGSVFVKQACISLGIDAQKLAVLPYGADLARFHAYHPVVGTGVLKVAFIGTVCYRKGADVVLKAWAQLATQFANIELHFYGNISMELPKNTTRVFYHGFVPQDALIVALRTAHISVLPSFLEGSSYAIYQSMALGLAVVTTPNSGSIVKNKHTGLLVPYGDVTALVDALGNLIANPSYRSMLVTNALEDITGYSWDAYGEKLSSLVKRQLDKTIAMQAS